MRFEPECITIHYRHTDTTSYTLFIAILSVGFPILKVGVWVSTQQLPRLEPRALLATSFATYTTLASYLISSFQYVGTETLAAIDHALMNLQHKLLVVYLDGCETVPVLLMLQYKTLRP